MQDQQQIQRPGIILFPAGAAHHLQQGPHPAGPLHRAVQHGVPARLEQAGIVSSCGILQFTEHTGLEPAPGQLGCTAARRGKAAGPTAQQHGTAGVQQHRFAAVVQHKAALGHQQKAAGLFTVRQRVLLSGCKPQGLCRHLSGDLFTVCFHKSILIFVFSSSYHARPLRAR